MLHDTPTPHSYIPVCSDIGRVGSSCPYQSEVRSIEQYLHRFWVIERGDRHNNAFIATSSTLATPNQQSAEVSAIWDVPAWLLVSHQASTQILLH